MAVTNLLQNAFKFTRAPGHVWLRTRATADRVFIDIEDECGGLPPGQAAELFRPFEQRSTDRSGLGLGLSISRKAVESTRRGHSSAESARQGVHLHDRTAEKTRPSASCFERPVVEPPRCGRRPCLVDTGSRSSITQLALRGNPYPRGFSPIDHDVTRTDMSEPMTKIQIYRDERGGWSFDAAEGRKVDAELADGYRLGEQPNGQLCIMGAPGELAMRASEAVRRGS